MGALDTAKSIQVLLSEHGIENDSLNAFINEASQLPDEKVLDEFNSLVEDYQRATGYDSIVRASEELLNFYNGHKEQLSHKANEMDQLDKTLEDYKQIHDKYEQLDAEIENGEL